MRFPFLTMLLLSAAECRRPPYYSESQSESAESIERPAANQTSSIPSSRVPRSHYYPQSSGAGQHRTEADMAQHPRIVAGNGREIQLEEVVRGDVKQTGSFGGQNFKIFDFEGQQWALVIWLPSMVGAFPMAMEYVETGHFRGTRSISDSKSSSLHSSREQQGKEIYLEEVRRGDVKQSGAFGGQNFSIFSFKGAQMAIYMFSPFSIYFADEAQDNEVENEGDDASSKNQYLSQSKYGQQRGAGPTFLYQPNFDNRRRLNLIKRLLKRQKEKKDSGEASPIPLSITDPTPVIIEGPSTKDIIAKLLKSSSSKKKAVAYSAENSAEDAIRPRHPYLPQGFPAAPIPFPGAPLPLPGGQFAPEFGALYG